MRARPVAMPGCSSLCLEDRRFPLRGAHGSQNASIPAGRFPLWLALPTAKYDQPEGRHTQPVV
jgi:hypothetical protein